MRRPCQWEKDGAGEEEDNGRRWKVPSLPFQVCLMIRIKEWRTIFCIGRKERNEREREGMSGMKRGLLLRLMK